MNQRINELRLEAGISRLHDEPKFMVAVSEEGKVIEPLDGLNKFAQLIVRECAEIADTERSNSVGCGYITKTNGMRIKEHFGVDE